MKKYILLIGSSVSIVILLLVTAFISGKSDYETISRPAIMDIYEYAECDAVIQSTDIYKKYSDQSGYIKESLKSVGDYVKEGEIINILAVTKETYKIPTTDEFSISGIDIDKILSGNLGEYEELINYYKNSLNDSVSAVTTDEIIEVTANKSGYLTYIAETGPVSRADVLYEISSLDNLELRINIPESKIYGIEEGSSVIVYGAAFPNKSYSGKISKIANVANNKSGSETYVSARATIDNNDGKLKPGYSAQVKIISEIKNNALLVDYNSVMFDGNGDPYVYEVATDKVIKSKIELGIEKEDCVEVLSGISKDTLIISNPKDEEFARIIKQK